MAGFFQKLFSKKKSAAVEVKTVPLPEKEITQAVAKVTHYKPTQFILGTAQSVGLQRDHNEDALFAVNTILSEGKSEYPFGIFIVADGMGGHQHGEVASGAAARVMGSYLISNLLLPLVNQDVDKQSDPIQEILVGGVEKVQAAVQSQVPGGGTTLTIAIVIDEQVTLAHIGDTRCYFIYPDQHFEIVTHDHSLVQRLIDLGQITEEDAHVHPQRNVLYRAIGQNEPFQPDIQTCPIPQPGYLLLCSDGLWGQVPNEMIAKIVVEAATPSLACHNLIQAANAAGGPDNISAVLVQFL